jgi:hypothetical protein
VCGEGAHVEAVPGAEPNRTHLIKEGEWAGHPPARGGKSTTHDEGAPQLSLPRDDDRFDDFGDFSLAGNS